MMFFFQNSNMRNITMTMISRFSVAVTIALLLASCAPQHRKDMEQIDSLRVGAEHLVKAQSFMGFQSWAHGALANQDSLYRAYAYLFTRDNIALVRKAVTDEPDSLQKKRLRYLLRYLSSEYIAKEVAPLTDRVSNYEASATIVVEGTSIPFRQIGTLLANEQRQARRALLYKAQDDVLDTLTTVLRRVEESSLRLSKELGYPSYTAMVSDLKEYSLEGFRSTAEEVLAATDSLYGALLKEMARRYLKLDPSNIHVYDLAPLFRNSQFDRYFPASSMLNVLHSTYIGDGIDIPAMKNLMIDSENRPTKNPRAVCYAIDVPTDIRLSIKPIGGFDDYSALFHEVGHALHYANTRENSFEFKYAGEPTVTEAYAFLSEYIITNQAWLRIRNFMPTPVLKDFVRFQAFYRLYFVRRYCAKFLYELQLHAGLDKPASLYVTLLRSADRTLQTASDAKRYLVDVDALYYSAGYLRAWFLECQLNAKLARDYGVNWFEHPEAGEYMRSLWSLGDRLNGDELVHILGYPSIATVAWLTEINEMIRFSSK
jgi:hypothetical protein